MLDYLLVINKSFFIAIDNHAIVVEQGMLFSLEPSWQLWQAVWEAVEARKDWICYLT